MMSAKQTSPDGHQVMLFGCQDRIVPIDNIKGTVGSDQEIAGMKIGMAQDEFRRACKECKSETLCAPDEIEDLSAF